MGDPKVSDEEAGAFWKHVDACAKEVDAWPEEMKWQEVDVLKTRLALERGMVDGLRAEVARLREALGRRREQLDVWTFAAMLWIAREASYDWSTPKFIEELHAILDKQSAALAPGGGRDGG